MGQMGRMSLITLAVMAALLLAGCRSAEYAPMLVYLHWDRTGNHVREATENVRDTPTVKPHASDGSFGHKYKTDMEALRRAAKEAAREADKKYRHVLDGMLRKDEGLKHLFDK